MSLLGNILSRFGSKAQAEVAERAAPQDVPGAASDERPPEGVARRGARSANREQSNRDAALAVARALSGASGPVPYYSSLPGSDPQLLAAIGEHVRAKLAAAAPSAARVAAENVDMYTVPDFLSADECSRLIELIDFDVMPSTILIAGADPTRRTSHTCKLSQDHPLVAEIEDRMAGLLGLPLSHGETLQGQRYTVGQQFKQHNDYFAAGQPYSEAVAKEGGQRTWTAMVFLNEPQQGGCTNFPKAGASIIPRRGTLLTWNNLNRQGMPNRSTHHEGARVEAGVKHVLTKWFREREWHKSELSDALRH